MSQFGRYSNYYDLLYENKDYVGESAYVGDLLDRFAGSASTVLELGCGTGKHAELLARAGRHVTGVEVSDQMLEQSVRRIHDLQQENISGSFKAVSGDARTVRVNETFDAVISLFHVVSYQTTNKDIGQMFDTAVEHLQPGGLFLFDLWYGPAVLSMQPDVRVKRMENDQISVIRIAEPELFPNDCRVDVNYTVFITEKATGRTEQLTELHQMRYYFLPELELLAESHGLELIHSEEWMTGGPPSEDTWGVCFAAKKS